ncbi:hypothetical protein [Dysgonomonas macrotermitis]|uniref:Uncharacterized protein n=1 Tax=Dysgonomonas macrotermitis TaxID=1346286 RepID=A0A1M5HAQ3_9BACT|nr:hypothetical protein [Dysgonomonas macrotermitis]SHG13055.1 hypothetical protein SAMN05444362_1163 [Dysgonomonas macrotermitis]
MSETVAGFFSFFVPLFMVLIHFWYISLPVICAVAFLYTKTKNEALRRIIRIFFAFVILSVICTGIYILISN